jgi:NADH:ubiquinone oxidoreductase subunit K
MLEGNGHMNTKTLKNLVLGFALGSFGLFALAATIPNTFTNGTVISSNAVNQNFITLNNAVTTLEGKVTALQATVVSNWRLIFT